MAATDPVVWITLSALGIGVAAGLVVWIGSGALARVPAEDREFKDAPPLGFRLAWWPIQWIAHYIRPLISERWHATLQARLRQAGLEFRIDAAQFTAARIVCAVCAAMMTQWLLASLAPALPGTRVLPVLFAAAALGWAWPALWLRDRAALRRRDLLKHLPFYLDIITLCVEAGLNLQGALNQAVSKGPPGALRDEFQRLLRDVRAGRARAAALRDLAERLDDAGVRQLVTVVIHAEAVGMSLGPVLRVQAEQRRAERFVRAERLALEAPVKMLLPLIAFIFPCTFIVLFFPIAMTFMASGL